jgi:hypothetical protein
VTRDDDQLPAGTWYAAAGPGKEVSAVSPALLFVRHADESRRSPEVAMRYALMIYAEPGYQEAPPDADRAAALDEFSALADDARCVAAVQLQPAETATCVRVALPARRGLRRRLRHRPRRRRGQRQRIFLRPAGGRRHRGHHPRRAVHRLPVRRAARGRRTDGWLVSTAFGAGITGIVLKLGTGSVPALLLFLLWTLLASVHLLRQTWHKPVPVAHAQATARA